jgi:hypothetical protein
VAGGVKNDHSLSYTARLRMSGGTPPLQDMRSWRAQRKRFIFEIWCFINGTVDLKVFNIGRKGS